VSVVADDSRASWAKAGTEAGTGGSVMVVEAVGTVALGLGVGLDPAAGGGAALASCEVEGMGTSCWVGAAENVISAYAKHDLLSNSPVSFSAALSDS